MRWHLLIPVGRLDAAAAAGDDRLQRMPSDPWSQDSFTYGTSQQRMLVSAGFTRGGMDQCNTFAQ